MMKNESYKRRREKIQTGDLFFSSSDSFISKTIRFFTASKVSHVGVFFWLNIEGEKRLFVAESVFSGIRILNASSIFQKGVNIYHGSLKKKGFTEKKRKLIKKRIFSKDSKYPLGSKYDFLGALFFFIKGKNRVAYCAEYASYILNFPIPIKYGKITPADIMNSCKTFSFLSE